MFNRKESFGVEFLFQNFKSRRKLSLAARLNASYKKRISSAFFVNVYIAVDNYFESVVERNLQIFHIACREKAVDFAIFVCYGKIHVPAAVIF